MSKLIIDASNLRAGGGIVHLRNLLRFVTPEEHGFKKVIVYGGQTPLASLPQRDCLDLREIPNLNRSFFHRLEWQQSQIQKLAEHEKAFLFVPGGFYLGKRRPFVTMFQNMQIFETPEKNREGLSKEWIRLHLLQFGQTKTFLNCSGLICISEYSKNYLQQFYPKILKDKPVCIIPHGIQQSYVNSRNYQFKETVRLLYVSTVKQYKHQWNLVEAVAHLRLLGFPLELHMIGSGDYYALKRMHEAIQKHEYLGKFVHYHGHLTNEATLKWYDDVDIFVFPSSCETFGISLLEAMAASLPIACSDRGPMPEVLRDAGVYFNPEQQDSIAASLKLLLQDETLRQTLGTEARSLSQAYTWENCAEVTFSFLQSVQQHHLS